MMIKTIKELFSKYTFSTFSADGKAYLITATLGYLLLPYLEGGKDRWIEVVKYRTSEGSRVTQLSEREFRVEEPGGAATIVRRLER